MTDLAPTIETIEQELLPMIAAMLDSLLATAQGAPRPAAAAAAEYADQLRILAEKSDRMARGAIAAALSIDSPMPHAASR